MVGVILLESDDVLTFDWDVATAGGLKRLRSLLLRPRGVAVGD